MAKKSEEQKKQQKINQAVEDLWRNGILVWKLKDKQKEIYHHFKNSDIDHPTCLISRQFGKSYTMCLLATEVCINQPNAIVKYVCPTAKMVERVIVPRMRDIIIDCPEDIEPKWVPSSKVWKFPNGSEIQVAGTDNGNYDNIRGGSAHLCIVDEAGFCDDLETVVFNVLSPTTDTTGGKVYLASTPNDKDPNHDFHEHFVFPQDADNKILKMTFYDSPMIDDKQRDRIIARYPGGISNIKFRCEYLCEIPNVSEANVIPEFVKVEEKIVMDVDKPDYCDFYTAMDVGFHDLTVALFGYYDFSHARLVITDEYIINGPELTTDKLYREVRHREKINFVTGTGLESEAYLRIMDNDLKLINDLSRFYGMTFIPTEKHGKEQAVDTVRRWVEAERVVISPKCKNLIYHLKYAQWHYTRQGTFTGKFKNLKGNNELGLLKSHADALDALIYLVRNIQNMKNPFPENYGMNINENTFMTPKWKNKNKSQSLDIMKKMLNLGKKDKS